VTLQSELPVLGRLFRKLGFNTDMPTVLLLIVGIFVFRGLLKVLEISVRTRASNTITTSLRLDLLIALNRMDYHKFLQWSRWNVTQLINTQATAAGNAFAFYANFLTGAVTLFIFTFASFYLNWEITIIGAVLGVFFGYKLKKLTRTVQSLTSEELEQSRRLNSTIIQSLNSFKYLKATNSFEFFREHLKGLIYKKLELQNKIGLNRGIIAGATQPVSAIVLAVSVFYTVLIKHQDIASVLVSIGLLYKATLSLIQAIQNWHMFAQATPHLQDVLKNIVVMKSRSERIGKVFLGGLKKQIEFSNVSLSFDSREVLTNINLVIRKGQTVGICGPSGAGKTTITDLLMGLIHPTSGSVWVDDHILTDLNVTTWQSHLGYGGHEPSLFEDSILNNVSLWDNTRSQQDIQILSKEALKEAAALSFVEELPFQLNTKLGEKGVSLSAGQKQRLAIAREIYKNKDVIIFDEATNSIDSETERKIKQTIAQWHGHKTIIIISHQSRFLEQCDVIYVLSEGKIIESGSFDFLQRDPSSHFYKLHQGSSELT